MNKEGFMAKFKKEHITEEKGYVLSVLNMNGIYNIQLKDSLGDSRWYSTKGMDEESLKSLDTVKFGDYVSFNAKEFVIDTAINDIEQPKGVKFIMSTDSKVQMLGNQIENAIKNGNDPSIMYAGIEKYLKKTKTFITLSTDDNPEKRYRQGEKIITYSAVEFGKDGKAKLVMDLWGVPEGEVNTWEGKKLENTDDKKLVVLSNGPVKYPEDYPEKKLRGVEVKGTYHGSKFTIDQKNGKDTLQDEYISDVDFVKSAYKVNPKKDTTSAYKQEFSYGFSSPSHKTTFGDKSWRNNLEGSERVHLFTVKPNGQFSGYSNVHPEVMEKTYGLAEELLSTKGITTETSGRKIA